MTSVDEVWSEVCGVNGGVLFLLMWDDISRRGLIWGLRGKDPALPWWSLSTDRCCSDRSLLESVVMEILPPVAWRNMKTQTEALTSYETPANEYFTFVSQVYKLLEPARDISVLVLSNMLGGNCYSYSTFHTIPGIKLSNSNVLSLFYLYARSKVLPHSHWHEQTLGCPVM